MEWLILILGGGALIAWLTSSRKKPQTDPSGKARGRPEIRVRVQLSSRFNEEHEAKLRGPAIPARWIPPGESIVAAGINISGGMLYYGSDLRTPNGGLEPALIEPRLPVGESPVDLSVRRMGYWPSYSTIEPDSRRAYLDWLAAGRRDPVADVGYAFLFFYGLERRVLLDSVTDPTAGAEIDPIENEIHELLTVYGGSGSFRSYATGLLEFNRIARSGGVLLHERAHDLPTQPGMSLAMQVGLGRMAASGDPGAATGQSALTKVGAVQVRFPKVRPPKVYSL